MTVENYKIDILNGARLQRGWSRVELSRRAGVDAKTVTNVLDGRHASPQMVRRLADALGVPMTELVNAPLREDDDGETEGTASRT